MMSYGGLLKRFVVANFDYSVWVEYCANSLFQSYVEKCRAFDPVGFDRAIHQDEQTSCFDFRRVIVQAFINDLVLDD